MRFGACVWVAFVGAFLGCLGGCKLGCATGREVGVEAGGSREPREGGTGNGKTDIPEFEGYGGWRWGVGGGGARDKLGIQVYTSC